MKYSFHPDAEALGTEILEKQIIKRLNRFNG
jgi:hypothetical protein